MMNTSYRIDKVSMFCIEKCESMEKPLLSPNCTFSLLSITIIFISEPHLFPFAEQECDSGFFYL